MSSQRPYEDGREELVLYFLRNRRPKSLCRGDPGTTGPSWRRRILRRRKAVERKAQRPAGVWGPIAAHQGAGPAVRTVPRAWHSLGEKSLPDLDKPAARCFCSREPPCVRFQSSKLWGIFGATSKNESLRTSGFRQHVPPPAALPTPPTPGPANDTQLWTQVPKDRVGWRGPVTSSGLFPNPPRSHLPP